MAGRIRGDRRNQVGQAEVRPIVFNIAAECTVDVNGEEQHRQLKMDRC
jgi:hypothetical protein